MMELPSTDFFLSQGHYADHILPVEEELVRRRLGTRVCTRPSELNSDAVGPVVVASYGDLCKVRHRVGWRPLVLMEHGAGQTYSGAGADAYADGKDLSGVALCLVPGYHAYQHRVRHAPKSCRVVKVGLTKLNDLLVARSEFYRERKRPGQRPTVAFGWHWDCHVCPETHATWPRWISAVQAMALDGEWDVMGHGHPREWFRLLLEYRERRIRPEPRFEKVVARCDVYCVDNSSTAFEAVAAGIPVVLLDSPGWEKARHGLRFGMEAGYLDRCSDPANLKDAVAKVLGDVPGTLARQQKALHTVYDPRLGGPAAAADAIELLLRGIRGPIL